MAADSRKGKKTAAAPAPTRSYALIGVLALAGVAVLAYLVTRPKSVSIPANVEVLAADTAGFRGYLLGSETAPVEITEYADFQCPACQTFELIQFHAVKRQLIDQGLLRWRYRDFPLAQHRNSRLASHAAACANDQGKYWEVHYAIYHNQATWAGSNSATGIFRDMARQAGVDVAAYDECMESARYAGRIQASLDEGLALGVASTPTFLINGRLYPGVLSSDSIAAMVRQLAPASTP